ncbi:MAG: protein adenylyltransferase SelO [Paracoccaceae bacterium]
MSVSIPFDNSYARLDPAFYASLAPTPVSEPSLLAWNTRLAQDLGIDPGTESDRASVFGGNTVPADASPIAQLYAGHQFGNWNPQLGDGRAILLGEVTPSNKRFDIQLKGSGPTPFSRMGDGRAWLGPVLREYVVSEAMHAFGVPTTRALAAVATGESVFREQGALPGAVLTRVASSHLRVGTFQIFAARGQTELLQDLTDYAIARHYPDADGPMGLLQAVVHAQAQLVAHWMSLGFIHGVMNTDNCTISGETIDYGPCAFMDSYDEARVFSSIDQTGRYAYGNQPRIIVWNMAQFATSLIQLFDDKDAAVTKATDIVHGMPALIQDAWLSRFGRKIGIADATPEDQPLIEELLALMQSGQSDFTNTFHALGTGNSAAEILDQAAFTAWLKRWQDRLKSEKAPEDVMRKANPVLIPRNHRIEEMIETAVAGDMTLFDRMTQALSSPYDVDAEFDDLRRAPKSDEVVPATFCGT